MVPPEGKNSIVATSYRIGGGALGNVNANTLTSLGRALAYIESVTNPMPATGGADRETIDEAKARAPYTIKSRDRAVTTEDYEMLALRASTQLARAQVRARSLATAVTSRSRCVPKARDARRGADAPARAVERDPALREELPRRAQARRHGAQRGAASLQGPLAARRADPSLGRNVRSAAQGHRAQAAPLPALARRRARRQGLGVRPAGAQGRADPPRRGGARRRGRRSRSRSATSSATSAIEHLRLDDDELPFLVHVHVAEKVRDDIK